MNATNKTCATPECLSYVARLIPAPLDTRYGDRVVVEFTCATRSVQVRATMRRGPTTMRLVPERGARLRMAAQANYGLCAPGIDRGSVVDALVASGWTVDDAGG